jgi:hypothetical protein
VLGQYSLWMCNLFAFDVAYTQSLQLVVADSTLCTAIFNIVGLRQVIFKSEKIMAYQTLRIANDSVIFVFLQDLLDRFASSIVMLAVYLALVYIHFKTIRSVTDVRQAIIIRVRH